MSEALEKRDRYIDLMRAGSILVVICGHWLLAAVSWSGGQLQTGNLLALIPTLQLATWVLQVMPIFFVVGGFSNATSWASTQRQGGSYADFMARRLTRLLRPLTVLLAIWAGLSIVLWALAPAEIARIVLLISAQPLWFISLYILVIACTPLTLAAHRRFGLGVPLALIALVAAGDSLRLGFDIPAAGYLNYAAVWLFTHQLGYLYADGWLLRLRPGQLVGMAAGALALLAALTTFGPYPQSMVGLPGERISNMAPPTICIVVLSVWQLSALLLLRPLALRWLARPAVWRLVIGINLVIMTLFLWHLTALILVVAALYGAQIPLPEAGTASWWLLRPVWFGILGVVLALLVRLFGRWELNTPAAAPPAGPKRWRTVASAGGVVLSVLGLACLGLVGLNLFEQARLFGLTLIPPLGLIYLGAGTGLVATASGAGGRWVLAVLAGLFGLFVLVGALSLPVALPETGANMIAHLLMALFIGGLWMRV